MRKVILFDFWGTLVENGVWSPIKQVKRILNLGMPFSDYILRMENAMMTKEFPSLKEAFVAVGDEFGIQCRDVQLEALVGMWNKSWMLAKPYDEVEEVLGKLQEKYELVLVSNTDCVSVKKVLDKYGLEKFFKVIALSCEKGMLKTNEIFLNNLMKELNVTAEECVVVGDSILSDMEAAKKVGIKGVLIDRRSSRDYSPRISSLRELEAQL